MSTSTLITPSQTELLAEACRRSLRRFIVEAWPLIEPGTEFVGNWHIDAICEHLEAVSRREIRRLIINVPPRHMKSISAAVAWPCWEWLSRPETKWLFASYAQSLSTRDSLKCRRLIRSRGMRDGGRELTEFQRVGYQGLLAELFDEPWQLADDQDAKQRFENTRKGYRLATSVGGAATGEGGDVVCIDDAHKTDEAESETMRESVWEWFSGTMRTRLNQPKTGAFVVIMQRVHEHDLVGHLLEEGGWEHLCLPAEYEPSHPFVWPDDPRTAKGEPLWSARIGADELAELKKMGPYQAAGQLQQLPAPPDGFLFKRADFRYWRLDTRMIATVEERTYVLPDGDSARRFDAATCPVFQTVDTAMSEKETADWTVVATWSATSDADLILLDVRRRHFEEQQTVEFLRSANDEWGRPPMFIERFGAGRHPLSALQRDPGRPVQRIPAEAGTQSDKLTRAFGAITLCQRHKLFLPVDQPEWLGAFESELLSFPNGAHDDQVDVTSYAARLLGTVLGRPAGAKRDGPGGPPPHSQGVRSEQF